LAKRAENLVKGITPCLANSTPPLRFMRVHGLLVRFDQLLDPSRRSRKVSVNKRCSFSQVNQNSLRQTCLIFGKFPTALDPQFPLQEITDLKCALICAIVMYRLIIDC
jgi:hypothetical protein